MKEEIKKIATIEIDQLFSQLKSSAKGLTGHEAKLRFKKYGVNEIKSGELHGPWKILLRQFKSPLVILLVFAVIASYLLGDHLDSVVIIVIVILNAVLGFYQEYRSETVVAALRKYITHMVKVVRDNTAFDISTTEIVPGDVVMLRNGDIVPADIRVFEAKQLLIDESVLTGESVAVEKSDKFEIVQDQTVYSNIILMGTHVLSGTAKGVVFATALNTEFGHNAALISGKEYDSSFVKSLKHFGNFLLKVMVVMTVFVFLANAALGKGIIESFLFATALAIGITPEALPIIMTIALSRGALHMAQKKVIIRTMASVEDFGNMDTLCSDKTGTLTEGNLILNDALSFEDKQSELLLLYGILCSNKEISKESFNPVDMATEESNLAEKVAGQLKEYKLLAFNDFDFDRRRQSSHVQDKAGKQILIVKGAPDSVIKLISKVQTDHGIKEADHELKENIRKKIEAHEQAGFKVITLGYRELGERTGINDEQDLIYLGNFLFSDQVKKTAAEALSKLQALKIAIKIVSGDSAVIVRKVCNDVGLKIVDDKIITGDELDKLSDAELTKYAVKYNIFARVNPEQKLKIVRSLNTENHIVGFLGDGINDAPALKAADVGISVNTASAIAKDAADIILMQQSLSILADGVAEGRKTFANITKYLLNTVSANYGNIFTVAVSSLFLKFIPLLPSQILLTNLTSDLPLVTISTDNVDPELLKKPRKLNIRTITRFMVFYGIISSIFDLVLITTLIFVVRIDEPGFRTSWFILSVTSELVITFAIRTSRSIFRSNPSRQLVYATIMSLIFVILIMISRVRNLFGFVMIPPNVILLIIGLLIAYVLIVELTKRHYYKRLVEDL